MDIISQMLDKKKEKEYSCLKRTDQNDISWFVFLRKEFFIIKNKKSYRSFLKRKSLFLSSLNFFLSYFLVVRDLVVSCFHQPLSLQVQPFSPRKNGRPQHSFSVFCARLVYKSIVFLTNSLQIRHVTRQAKSRMYLEFLYKKSEENFLQF